MTEQAEQFTLNEDGTIEFAVDAESYRLRRPRFGEFRKLRELLHESQERLYDFSDRMKVKGEQLQVAKDATEKGETVVGADLATLAREVRDLDRQWTVANEEANLAWMREAVAMLSGNALPADDELPLWMADGNKVSDFIRHWRNVPLQSGER